MATAKEHRFDIVMASAWEMHDPYQLAQAEPTARAQHLLETTDMPMDCIAAARVGAP
ncbi:MAG: hypothetical protein V7751_15565 [Pseudoalteromonas distincta]